jgi:hypothetical protein
MGGSRAWSRPRQRRQEQCSTILSLQTTCPPHRHQPRRQRQPLLKLLLRPNLFRLLAVSRSLIVLLNRLPQLTPVATPQVVGIILAILSGILIGSSFVFKKKGLLRSQAGHAAGEGVAYLRSVCYLPALRRAPSLTNATYLTGIMVEWHD